jgi:hypothetical protein
VNNNLAPIVLFVYNRPVHTRHTVEALLENDLSSESDLIVYSDAPKSAAHTETVNDVREYIRQIDGFKSTTIIERDVNFGLSGSIIDGVTSVVNENGRVIVLEDDLVVTPYFLNFMNSALEVYESDDKVMHVSGYMFPVDNVELPETLFLRTSSCWGWATWARAWKFFEPDSEKLLNQIHQRKLEYEFDIHGTMGYMDMLQDQSSGVINSWAVRWYASVFLNNGLCLHPGQSLLSNAGHDGTGIHCGSSDIYDVDVSSRGTIVSRQEIKESSAGLEAIKRFYRSLRPPIHVRIIKKFMRTVLGRK